MFFCTTYMYMYLERCMEFISVQWGEYMYMYKNTYLSFRIATFGTEGNYRRT